MSSSSRASTRNLPRRGLQAALAWLWSWLRRPWLATLAGLIGLVLALAAWQLPQLPGQFVEEHAAAATWMLNISATYGIWGNALLALGLFDVLHSPLLYLLLALLVPTVAAQLADQLGALVQQHRLLAYNLSTTASAPVDALQLSTERPLYRWRGRLEMQVDAVMTAVGDRIQADFPLVKRAEVSVQTPSPAGLNGDAAGGALSTEVRFVGLRGHRLHYVRPLLMVGLLLCVAGAWIALAFGWQVTAPPLAPGAIYRSANRNLLFQYTVPLNGADAATLQATLSGTTVSLPATEASRQALGPASLQVRPSYPGIWIATAGGDEQLALPGESKLRSAIGLVFANPGSEESILLPNLGAGLRIVQRSGSDNFVLELYRSDAFEPVYRADLTPGGQLTIPLAPDALELTVLSRPGLQVEVRQLPGLWLVLVGAILALIGAIAFLRSSAFVIVQVAPWSAEHTAIVVQSDQQAVVADLQGVALALPPQPASMVQPKAVEET